MRTYKPLTYENALLVILGLGGAAAALDAQALYYLSPFLASDLHLNNTRIGLVSSIVVVTWAVSAYVVGSHSDRTSQRKKYLVAAFTMFAACSVLSGLAASFALLFCARALIGVAEGPVIPISQSIIMAESPPHRRGFNMGVVQNLGAQLVGAMLGPLIIVRLAEHFDWHAAFYLAGLPGLAVAILIAVYVREPPRPACDEEPIARRSSRTQLFGLLRHQNIRICILISCFVVAWYFLIMTYLPLYCVRVLNLSPARMSIVMAAMGAAGVVSSVMVPHISDRIGRKPVLGVFAFMSALAPLGPLLTGGFFAMLLTLVFVGGLAIGTTTLFMGTIPLETVPPRDAAAASGLILGVGQVVGGFSGPALAGVLADRFSLAVPLWIAFSMAVCAGLACLSLRETAPSRVGQQAAGVVA